MTIAAAVVVVPAKDEAETVVDCLRSVIRAAVVARASRPHLSVVVLLVADSCSDATEALARSVPGVRVLVSQAGRVGAARALGVSTGLQLALDEIAGRRNSGLHLPGRRPEPLASVWVANTDADSTVPPNWLVSQLDQADAGADVVVGTVRPVPAQLTAEQNARWLETHPRGRPNGHVHGANLGIRADAYARVGGFEPIDEHEDNQIAARLREAGAVFVASDDGEVLTSARLTGRTPGGYAGYLAATL